MEKKNFKTFCTEKLTELKTKLTKLKQEKENFQNTDDINLSSFGTTKELTKLYYLSAKRSFIKKILGPSSKDLKEFARQMHLRNLDKQITNLTAKINELERALPFIEDNTFTNEINPNGNIVETILEYNETNLVPASTLDLLISLFNQVQNQDKVEYQLEYTLGCCFNERNYPISVLTSDDITFMFEKLLFTLFDSTTLDKYRPTINSIINEINLRYEASHNISDQRSFLEAKRKSIEELQKYLQNGEIIATNISLSDFERLLLENNFSREIIDNYLQKMEIAQKEAEQLANQKKDKELTSLYLTEHQQSILDEALKIVDEIENPELKKLFSRSIKDVISLCRYLKLIPGQDSEYQLTYELLGEKITILQTEINKIKDSEVKKPCFYYIPDKEGIPKFLRNIESTDKILYGEIYELLNTLALQLNETVPLKAVEEVEIHSISSSNLTIKYALLGDIAVILTLQSRNIPAESRITLHDITAIKKIYNNRYNEEFTNLQTTFEQIILQSLDLKNPNSSYALKKAKKN